MKLFLRLLLVITILFSASQTWALTEAKWNNPEVKLGAVKAKILEIVGKPDTVDTGSEMYMLSDSKDLMMAVIEYKDDKVVVLGQIYKPDMALATLEKQMKDKGLTPLSKSEDAIVYFTKMPDSDLEYYLVLNKSTDEATGPGLAKMTKDAFLEAEKAEGTTEPAQNASATAQPEVKKEEPAKEEPKKEEPIKEEPKKEETKK